MVAATYQFHIDSKRDEGFDEPIDDLTDRLIGSINWNVGMTEADQSFAPPSRLSVTLDNYDGAFNPDIIGAEVLTNGDFASWSGDNPTGWTVNSESAGNPEVSEVGADETHNGTGTGAANFYSTSTSMNITQAALSTGTTYQVEINISASTNGTGYLTFTGSSVYYHFAGKYTYYFNAASTAFTITTTGAVNMTVTSVSVKAVSKYGNLISEGMLARLKITPGTLQYIGKIAGFELLPGSINRRVVVLQLTDWTLDYLDVEYKPELYTNVTVDEPLKDVFASNIVPWPYAEKVWLLGIQGSSELDLTTTLGGSIGSSEPYIDSGISVVAYVGDNAIDGAASVSAQSFMRDLIDAEIYGRFFYNPSLMAYEFHNRHRDALSTSAYTLTENDYEPSLSTFWKAPVLNKSTVNFSPRKTGTAGSVIWTADDVPIELPSGSTQIVARYRDADVPTARVGAYNIIPPAYQTDYIAVDENGSQADPNFIRVVANPSANSAELTVTNAYPFVLYMTFLRLRGTPLTTFSPRTISSENRESQIKYRFASEQISYNLIDTENLARSIADFRVYRNATPVSSFRQIGWVLNKDTNRQTRGLAMSVGTRFTVTDSWMGHNADYIVVGFRHSVVIGGEHTHEIVCTLKPADRENFWILNTSTLGDNTRLGL